MSFDKGIIHFANMQENNSLNANLVLSKLKNLMKISTDIELSELLNVKPNTISTWKKRNSLDYASIISICELYEINLNDIFFDKGLANANNQGIDSETPLVCRETQFQYCLGSPALLESLPKFNIPFIKGEDTRLFQVVSNNMFPIIEENSYAVCEKSEKSSFYGDVIVIISKTKGFFINRVFSDPENTGTYILKSENSFFTDIILNESDINEIWNIKGVLSYNFRNDNKTDIKDNVKKIKI